jgi:hypothetical protein
MILLNIAVTTLDPAVIPGSGALIAPETRRGPVSRWTWVYYVVISACSIIDDIKNIS